MYAGHFAAGLAIKARVPRAPTWGVLVGVGLLDLLFGPFVLLGIERAHMTPGQSPGFALDQIDWSHSLVMALIWAALYGALFLRRGGLIVATMAFTVFSHFLLDWPMHPGDLALWPGSAAHVGMGLWRLAPIGWWWFEFVFILGCATYYMLRARQLRSFGGRAAWAVAVVLVLHVANSPWLSPAA